jgi:hypothetical protein
MAHWLMQVVTGLFSIWAPDFDEDLWHDDPLASV